MTDPNYLRKAPEHDPTYAIDVLLSKLSEATFGDFDGCACDSCRVLKMWRNADPAHRVRVEAEQRARQEAIEQDKLNDIE